MQDVSLKTQPVELCKILKFAGLAPSGGAAKLAIESGDVRVNGEVEMRKRKKIVAGDIIQYNDQTIRVLVND